MKTHAKTLFKGLFSYLKNMCLGCVSKAQGPFTRMISSGGTRIFCGGIEGAKCDSEGANIQKNCPKWLILAIFSSNGGGGASEGKQNLRLRGEMSLCPLDAATDDIQPEIQVPPGVKVDI